MSAPPHLHLQALGVKVLAFDLFGTLFDWRGSIIAEGKRFDPTTDWETEAFAWAKGYSDEVCAVREGRKPWRDLGVILDGIGREILSDLDVGEIARGDLRSIWRRLKPWPDVVDGMALLHKSGFRLAAFSNADPSLINDLSSKAGLVWDHIVSASDTQTFKPDPEVYRGGAWRIGEASSRIALVAAHAFDLVAAGEQGYRTIFLRRDELGRGISPRFEGGPFDLCIDDLRILSPPESIFP